MITPEDILNLNFYKKEKFTGSYKGMRYLIQKDHEMKTVVRFGFLDITVSRSPRILCFR